MSRSRASGSRRSGREQRSGIWTRHLVTEAEARRTLQEVLIASIGVSGRMIQRLTRSHGILVNGRSAYLKRKVKAGEVIAVRIGIEEDPGLEPVPMELAIVLEDDHLLVVNKPAGLLVHPVGPSGEATLAHGITHHLLEAGVRTRVRPVHRLDRDTSGLLLVAKHAFAHQALDRQLRQRQLQRRYVAFVEGSELPPEGVIDAPIGRHPHQPNLRSVTAGGDDAVTRYRVLERYHEATQLEAELETGRTHQIRVHLSHIGHPLIGDVRYGASRRSLGRQALHAAHLAFQHPLGGEHVQLSAPLPEDLQALRRELREQRAEGPLPQG